MNIKELLQKKNLFLQEIIINGWVRSFRSNRFIVLTDDSSLNNLQIIVMESNFSKELLKKITVGIALLIKGSITESPGKKQVAEVISIIIQIYNKVSVSELNKTILQPKHHKLEKLREQAHLRFSTRLFGSIMRIRHQLSFYTHLYFYYHGFYIHTPIILLRSPIQGKAFYMRLNADEKTVSSMDIIFPIIGEVIGGSQREERYELLLKRMQSIGVAEKTHWWYIKTRRFGFVPNNGFGLGFDGLVQFVTGMLNIRDVIPFPRTPKNAEF